MITVVIDGVKIDVPNELWGDVEARKKFLADKTIRQESEIWRELQSRDLSASSKFKE